MPETKQAEGTAAVVESPREEVKTPGSVPGAPTSAPPPPTVTPREGEGVSPPPEAAAPPPEVRDMPLELDGKEYLVTKSEARLLAQKAFAADKRFAEAARQKQVLDAKEAALQDPKHLAKTLEKKFLSESGGDRALATRNMKEFLAKNLGEILAEEEAPPEEKYRREKERLLSERERLLMERERAIEEEAQNRKRSELDARIERELPLAVKAAGLPPDVITQEMILRLAMQAEASGNDKYTLEQAATELKLYGDVQMKGRLDAISPEEVETRHPDLYKRIVDSYVKRIRAQAQGTPTPKPSTPQKDEAQAGRTGQAQTLSDRRREIEARIDSRVM